MSFLFRAIFGVAAMGGSAIAPMAVRKAVSALENKGGVAGNLVASAIKQVVPSSSPKSFEEIKSERENVNFSEVFKDLNSKDCQLIKNPAGSQNGFHTLYACKRAEDKKNKNVPTIFYYLGARDSVKEMSKGSMKEIETINYKDDGQIVLKLKDSNQEISISVMAGEGGWSHFRNVNLSKQCQVETKLLGGDDLRCKLTDTQGKTFFYNFSVF